MRYLLDTNSWIDHFRRGETSKVSAKLFTLPTSDVCLCSIVLGELLYGALVGPSTQQAANLALVGSLQGRFASLSVDDVVATQYAKIRAHLKNLGTPIGPNDLLIAAIALAHQLVLVTHNTKEFSRVPGLILEDWQ